MNNHTALLIVDAQRGFMPAGEGHRLWMEGFGELPVPGSEQIIAPLNRLIGAAALGGLAIATTQDWHPYETAHFAPEGTKPNFTTTWPRHCIAYTPGAELHPGLLLPGHTRRFIKGSERLTRGEDDLSYSGYYAHDRTGGQQLPDWLRQQQIDRVILGGLALDYCVGKTAIDLREKLDLDVVLATDTTRPVAEATSVTMMQQLAERAVRFATSNELIAELDTASLKEVVL